MPVYGRDPAAGEDCADRCCLHGLCGGDPGGDRGAAEDRVLPVREMRGNVCPQILGPYVRGQLYFKAVYEVPVLRWEILVQESDGEMML